MADLDTLLSSLTDDKADPKQVASGFAGVLKDFDTKSEAATKARAEAMSPYEAEGKKLTEQIGGLEKRIASIQSPDAPKMKELPEVPNSQFQDPTQALGGIGSLIAVIGSLATRAPATAALNSMAAAMQGFHKGDQERVTLEREKAQDQMQRALRQNQQELQEYNAALQKSNFDLGKAQAEFTAIAAKHNDLNMRATIETGNQSAQWQLLQQRAGLTEKAVTFMGQMKEREEARKAREQARLDNLTLHRDQMAQTRELALMRIGAQGGGTGGGGAVSAQYGSDPDYKKRVDTWATMVKTGVPLPSRFAQMVGRQMAGDVFKRAGDADAGQMIANRISQKEMMSEASKIGTQAASVAIANKEVAKFIPLAVNAVDAVARVGWRPVNDILKRAESAWSPEEGKLVIANRSLQTAYAQLIQRGAPTVHSSQEAEEMLNGADSPAVYKAKAKQLYQEGVEAEKALQETKDDLLGRAKSMGSSGADTSASTAGKTVHWDDLK